MGSLILYGILAAVVLGSLGALHHSIYSSGEEAGIAAQVKVDAVIVKRVTAERDEARAAEKTREAENNACAATVLQQNGELTRLGEMTRAAQAQSTAVLAARADAKKANDAFIAELQARANAAPQGDRNAQCDRADATATDALRRMREQP